MQPLFTESEIDQMTDNGIASMVEHGRIQANMADFFRPHIRQNMVELYKSQEAKIAVKVAAAVAIKVAASIWQADATAGAYDPGVSYDARSSEGWPHV